MTKKTKKNKVVTVSEKQFEVLEYVRTKESVGNVNVGKFHTHSLNALRNKGLLNITEESYASLTRSGRAALEAYAKVG